MLITEKCFIFNLNSSYLLLKKNVTTTKSIITLAQKRDLSENSTTKQQQYFPIRVSNPILPRVAVALFGLGFVDAGYSRDWSRIGVISEETEALLKVAAFVVVPLFLAGGVTSDCFRVSLEELRILAALSAISLKGERAVGGIGRVAGGLRWYPIGVRGGVVVA
ncbi:hypothetical protein LWI29_022626 [Acer saccharum]|uniref:DUF7887 domain-containing protein n=1 Tax=Acer saccharum TaxID=4024 RepID=A0AA39REM7_ACESA|nr:hypothetical protein LWI29_022626 [Acer saccharum]